MTKICLLQDKVINVHLFLNKIFYHITHVDCWKANCHHKINIILNLHNYTQINNLMFTFLNSRCKDDRTFLTEWQQAFLHVIYS
jgi:hypothetical protein